MFRENSSAGPESKGVDPDFEASWLPDGQVLEGSPERGFQTVALIEFEKPLGLIERAVAALGLSPAAAGKNRDD